MKAFAIMTLATLIAFAAHAHAPATDETPRPKPRPLMECKITDTGATECEVKS